MKPLIIHSMIRYYLRSGVLAVYVHMQVYEVSVQANILTHPVLFLRDENFPLTLSSRCIFISRHVLYFSDSATLQ